MSPLVFHVMFFEDGRIALPVFPDFTSRLSDETVRQVRENFLRSPPVCLPPFSRPVLARVVPAKILRANKPVIGSISPSGRKAIAYIQKFLLGKPVLVDTELSNGSTSSVKGIIKGFEGTEKVSIETTEEGSQETTTKFYAVKNVKPLIGEKCSVLINSSWHTFNPEKLKSPIYSGRYVLGTAARKDFSRRYQCEIGSDPKVPFSINSATTTVYDLLPAPPKEELEKFPKEIRKITPRGTSVDIPVYRVGLPSPSKV